MVNLLPSHLNLPSTIYVSIEEKIGEILDVDLKPFSFYLYSAGAFGFGGYVIGEVLQVDQTFTTCTAIVASIFFNKMLNEYNKYLGESARRID